MNRHASATPVHAGARLDRLPVGRFQQRAAAIIGATMFVDFFDFGIAGALLGSFLHSGWTTIHLNALFISGTGLGGVIGNLGAGFLADRFGRKSILRVGLFLVGVATLAAAFAPNMTWLIGLRIVAGIGMGALPTVGWSFLAELMPPGVRGRWSGYAAMISASSGIVASLAGYLLLPIGAWRWMFIIPGLACLLLWQIARRLPESPRWLAAVGRTDEAEHTLRMIEREFEERSGTQLAAPETSANSGTADPIPLHVLFRPPYLRRLVLAAALAVGGNTAIYALISWLPTMLLREGLSISNVLGANFFISFGGIAGALLSGFFADYFGRRISLIIGSLVAIGFAAAFALNIGPGATPLLGFLLQTSVGTLCGIILNVYIPELFPTEFRVRAGSIAVSTSRLASIGLPFIMAPLITRGGLAGGLSAIAGCLLIIAVSMTFFGTETARKPLEFASRE